MCLLCVVDAQPVLRNFIPGWHLYISTKEDGLVTQAHEAGEETEDEWPLGWYGFVRFGGPDLVFHVDDFVADPCLACSVNSYWDYECDKLPDKNGTYQCDRPFVRHTKLSKEIPLDDMSVHSTVSFYNACVSVGYDPKKFGYNLQSWVMDRIARMLWEYDN